MRMAGDVGSGLERFDVSGIDDGASDGGGGEGVHFGGHRTFSGGGFGGVGGGSGGGGSIGTRSGGGGGDEGDGFVRGSSLNGVAGVGFSSRDGLSNIAVEEGRKATPRIVVYAASTHSEGINLGAAGGGGGGGGKT